MSRFQGAPMLHPTLLATLIGLCAAVAMADSEVCLGLRNDGQPGSGTAAAFDACFARLGPNSVVHLGVGAFHTKGEAAFTLKPNTKVRGGGFENQPRQRRDQVGRAQV